MLKLLSVGKKLQSAQGLSLLEVLVAVAFLGIAVSALVGLTMTSLKNSGTSRNVMMADQYAREGLEMLRSYRDNEGWDEFKSIANNVDWAIWGSAGPTSPTCSISHADRYYYVFEVPAAGVPALGTNGVACGTHAEFQNMSHWNGQWLNNWCTTTTWTTQPSGNPYINRGTVVQNFYRVVIIGFEDDNKAFVRSVVCYYENANIRSVQVDSYLTNWR